MKPPKIPTPPVRPVTGDGFILRLLTVDARVGMIAGSC